MLVCVPAHQRAHSLAREGTHAAPGEHYGHNASTPPAKRSMAIWGHPTANEMLARRLPRTLRVEEDAFPESFSRHIPMSQSEVFAALCLITDPNMPRTNRTEKVSVWVCADCFEVCFLFSWALLRVKFFEQYVTCSHIRGQVAGVDASGYRRQRSEGHAITTSSTWLPR